MVTERFRTHQSQQKLPTQQNHLADQNLLAEQNLPLVRELLAKHNLLSEQASSEAATRSETKTKREVRKRSQMQAKAAEPGGQQDTSSAVGTGLDGISRSHHANSQEEASSKPGHLEVSGPNETIDGSSIRDQADSTDETTAEDGDVLPDYTHSSL